MTDNDDAVVDEEEREASPPCPPGLHLHWYGGGPPIGHYKEPEKLS